LDFEFGRNYQESLAALKQFGVKVGIATTRILKPKEYRNLNVLMSLNPDFILARNLGAVGFLQTSGYKGEIAGDFSLNVTNHLTANYLLSKGLRSLCAGYDLNSEQLSDLLKVTNAKNMEVTVYQYMPSFHMEHCVFAAFLSQGSSYKDCGKPCEKHDLLLKDQFGNLHQIKPDHECRNTMYNSKSQSAARFVNDWSKLGLGFVRYEALKEKGEELIVKILAHQDLLAGRKTFEEAFLQINSVESYGLSEKHFARTKEYDSRKKGN
jgi:putative protease